MHLSPEQFLEKYREEGLPFFKIFKGNSSAEKACLARFMESESEGYELLNEGAAKLEQFFEMYPSGFVTVMTKGSPNSRSDSANYIQVKWGAESVGATNMMPQQKGYAQHPAAMFGGFDKMMGFFAKMYEGQSKAQLAAIEAKNEARIREMEMRMEHKEAMEKLMLEYGQPEPSMGEILQQELIGLIRPAATHFFAQNGIPTTHTGAGVYGMENTLNTEDEPGSPEVPPQEQVAASTATNAPQHPMMGASMDTILYYVRQIAENVFPEYNVNELMPVMALKMVEYKDLLRSQFIPELEARRKAKQQQK